MKLTTLRLLISLGAFGSTVLAQTFSDVDFHEADWEAYKIRFLSNQLVETNAAGTFSVRQNPTGGRPGAFREITIDVVNYPVAVANMQKAAVWSLAVQGALYRVSFVFFARSVPPDVSAIGFSPILSQDGFFYRSDSGYLPVSDQWGYADFFQNLEATAWDRADGQPGHPDFSTNGAPLQFGYLAIAHAPAGQSVTSGLDDWLVRLTPVSEPRLSITPIPNEQVLLTWSREHIDYRLEAASSLSAPIWTIATNNVNDMGEQLSVLAGARDGSQFFRLSK